MSTELEKEVEMESQENEVETKTDAIAKNFNSCMTVYYSTLSGKIFNIITGENNMDVFDGDVDAMANKSFTIIPFDEILLRSLFMYYFDLEEKRIRLKPEYVKYI